MRLDPDHVQKLSRAIEESPNGPEVKFDLAFMNEAKRRLSLWEMGLLTHALTRASIAKRRSVEQRALLALFVHDGGEAT